MPSATLNIREILAALTIAGLGLFMVVEGLGYPFGALQRMGPGFFPVVLGVMLVGLGTAVALEFRRAATDLPADPPRPSVLRPFIMIIGAVAAFAVLLPRWGLLPATFALVLLSAAGDRPFRPFTAIATAAALSLGGYVFFIRVFGLPLDLLWW